MIYSCIVDGPWWRRTQVSACRVSKGRGQMETFRIDRVDKAARAVRRRARGREGCLRERPSHSSLPFVQHQNVERVLHVLRCS